MDFLICETDEENFEHVVLMFPLVGTHDRFVLPGDLFEDPEHDLLELGITLHQIL